MAKASIEEIELHNLILARDDRAFAMLCDRYLENAIQSIIQFNPKVHLTDSSLIPQIVIDSFYSYFERPEKFNGAKQSLVRFLIMDAEADLKNALAKQKRLASRLVAIGPANENELESDTPELRLINREAELILQAELSGLFENEIDVEIANLILLKERETGVYADVLKITHLDFEEQQREVKRHKDRIKKVLARKLKGKHY
jgi:RNA polymerase sigma-70 factor (ECF subfamily)